MVWTHHDIAEILLELALNTTQSINVVVDVLVNFVNSSMRKFKTMIMPHSWCPRIGLCCEFLH